MADGAFDFASRRVLTAAFSKAREFSHSCLCSEHILLGILSRPDEPTARVLEAQGIRYENVEHEILSDSGRGRSCKYTAEISREAASVLESAGMIAGMGGQISPANILLAILRQGDCRAAALLDRLGADRELMALNLTRPPREGARKPRGQEPKLLLRHGVDMTKKARDGEYDRLVGREEELERVMRVLCRRRKANPVLLGEAGVGKTAVAEGLAAAIASGRVPPPLKGMRVISIDMASIVAGTKYRGEFEEKARGLIDEAQACGDIILFIDELHTVAGAGAAEGAIDAGNILKPALARGSLRILGATTPAEYRKYIASDTALERRFQPIDLSEPDRAATLAILRSSAAACRRYYGVEAGEDALVSIERLCRRFMPQRRFPDKAIDVLDEASAMAMTEGAGRLESRHVKRVVAQMSGLGPLWSPEGMIGVDELRDRLSGAVIGQEEAVEAAVSAVASAMAFPGGRGRPQGVMLFCGPSGTGKTLLAKKLAESLFGDAQALIRFDMSEYREGHTVSRLIGSPPGYAGYGGGGLLTEAVRRRPFSVLLFDEIEKAHPEVLNLLLQLLEDGVLTDAEGNKADFKSAIVIMTSNVGSAAKTIGFGGDRSRSIKAELAKSFSPELMSRIDRIAVFSPLSPENLAGIAENELKILKNRLAEEGLALDWEDGVPALLASNASDGRRVRVNVAEQVEEPLAFLCLGAHRPSEIYITAEKGRLRLTPEPAMAK